MNIQRFTWPAIVAAGLHGALFLFLPEVPHGAAAPLKKVIEVPLRPVAEEPWVAKAEDPDEQAASSGAAKPLPSQPEELMRPKGNEPFTVPVEPYRTSIDRVERLPDAPGRPTGLEAGPWPFVPPAIPDAARLDRMPRAMVQPAPDYPTELHHAGVIGSVTVEFVVDTGGRVVKAEAVKWTHREFAEPAVRAVRRWRFEPGTLGGRKVSFRMAVPIDFSLGN